MHTPKKFQTKFQPKKVIVVEYKCYSQKYKLFDPVTGKFYVSRDVVQSTILPDENRNVWDRNLMKNAAPSIFENGNDQLSDQEDIQENAVQEKVKHEIDAAEDEPFPKGLRDHNTIQRHIWYRNSYLTASSATINEPQSFKEATSSLESKFRI